MVAVVVAISIAVPVSIPISFVAAVSPLAFISHWVTLEIVGIGMDRADVVLIMIAVIVTHPLLVMLLFTGILGLIACFRELLAGTREMIEAWTTCGWVLSDAAE